jgi:hypothetical protein
MVELAEAERSSKTVSPPGFTAEDGKRKNSRDPGPKKELAGSTRKGTVAS